MKINRGTFIFLAVMMKFIISSSLVTEVNAATVKVGKVTRMLEDVKIQFKVRAYRKKGGKKVYGKFSKVLKYTEKEILDYNHNGKLITKGLLCRGKG